MSQTDKMRAFRDLHVPGQPLVLMNVWDAGSAKVVSEAGAGPGDGELLSCRGAWL